MMDSMVTRRWRYSGIFVLAMTLGLSGIPQGVAQVATYVEPEGEPGQGHAGHFESWLFNPKERTRAAMVSANRGEPKAAIAPLETAMRLEPGSVVTRYNAGTARLAADQSGALALLQAAALTEMDTAGDPAAAIDDLLPSVNYNLGNARMKEEDFAGAIEAFKNTLRLDSAYEDAKFNLELAQRLLQEQQQQNSEDEQAQDQQEENEQQQQQDQQQQDQQQQDQQQQQQDQSPPPSDGDEDLQGQEQQKESPLPQFRDLPDMSAEEAASILEAVENLERERRREEAEKAARKNGSGNKDW